GEAIVRRNEVHDNGQGISSSGLVTDNRVFHNTGIGIQAVNAARVLGNVVYDNATGIVGTTSFFGPGFSGRIANNVVYDNRDRGIRVGESTGGQVVNNTIVQLTGEAVRVEGSNGVQ